MRNNALAAALLSLCVAGCAAQAAELEKEPVRFAVIAAPRIGGDAEDAEVLREDLLLEAVTQLSTSQELAFCLVPGPLLGANDADARELLIGAVGSLAADAYVAIGPDDGPREEVLELFGESLPHHDGEAAYDGKAVRGVRPMVLAPDGSPPPTPPGKEAEDSEEEGPVRIAVQGGAAAQGTSAALTVLSGPELELEVGSGGARLVVPPLEQPPHLYVVATLSQGEISLELRSALDLPLPEPPPPIRLTPGAPR